MSVDEVLAALPDGRFSITDLQEATGAARVTVSRAIAKAAAEGLVEEDGLAPRQGPGRRPVAYRRVRSDVS